MKNQWKNDIILLAEKAILYLKGQFIMRRASTALLAFVLLLSIILITPSFAVSTADDKISADINLEVGTMSGSTFTPLPSGTILKANDVITVRISPKTDFLCGASRYIVMFSSAYLQIVGTGKEAFTPNTANTFYQEVASGYSGATAVPKPAWPDSLKDQFSTYTAVAVSNLSDSNSNNGGHPDYLPGTWLFRFNLKVTKDITGSGARIWMDDSWFERPSYTTGAAYFVKCTSASQLSTEGSATIYDFKIDVTGANITLKAGSTSTTETTKPATTKPATTSPVTTKPGTTSTTKPVTTNPVTTKPGTTATTNPGTSTTANTGTTVTKPGTMTTVKPGATTTSAGTTAAPQTTAAPVKIPTDEVSKAADKTGVTDWDGEFDNLTPDQKKDVKEYLEKNGKNVEVKEDGFYYVETTSAETQTTGDGQTASTTEAGNNSTASQNKIMKTVIILLAVVAVIGLAVLAVNAIMKKKQK